MEKALAVIGSGYGDEGKGLMTDYLASVRGVPAVVRTNGGAQAGHTVQTPDGRRHVFHHIASGALAGAATHLSQFFVCHPIFFMQERAAILGLGGNAAVSVDPRSPVTTPYDIMINQAIEKARGGARHGSCGMGFGETVERTLREEFSLTVGDFSRGGDHVCRILDRIRLDWVRSRLDALGLADQSAAHAEMLSSTDLVARFLADCAAFRDAISVLPDAVLPDGVLFEGAQGLLLDQDYGAFPHVTRSNTGLKNMITVAKEAGFGGIDVTYMTRAYSTRHGAGPFAFEGEDMSWLSMVDPTNEPNDWQGAIRTSPLDLDSVAAAIRQDLQHGNGAIEIAASVGISCVDQVGGLMKIGSDGHVMEIQRRCLAEAVSERTGLGVEWMSFGPTRSDIREFAATDAAA